MFHIRALLLWRRIDEKRESKSIKNSDEKKEKNSHFRELVSRCGFSLSFATYAARLFRVLRKLALETIVHLTENVASSIHTRRWIKIFVFQNKNCTAGKGIDRSSERLSLDQGEGHSYAARMDGRKRGNQASHIVSLYVHSLCKHDECSTTDIVCAPRWIKKTFEIFIQRNSLLHIVPAHIVYAWREIAGISFECVSAEMLNWLESPASSRRFRFHAELCCTCKYFDVNISVVISPCILYVHGTGARLVEFPFCPDHTTETCVYVHSTSHDAATENCCTLYRRITFTSHIERT